MSNRSPSVSVVIPAYNVAKYVRETLDSVLAQTFGSFEVIVVDDGSTDGTAAILREYGDRIVVSRQANQGRAAACNAGARLAQGEWIALVDADDVWLPEKLTRQVDQCGRYAMSYTDSVFFGDGIEDQVKSAVMPQHHGRVLEPLLLNNFITGSSVMIRKGVFFEHGGFDVTYGCVQDWPFWLKICAQHELGYLPEPLVRYRVHQEATSANTRRTLAARQRVLREAFGPSGVGASHRGLRRAACANSYLGGVHTAGTAGQGWLATQCAIRAVLIQPSRPSNWKWLLKALSVAVGVKY